MAKASCGQAQGIGGSAFQVPRILSILIIIAVVNETLHSYQETDLKNARLKPGDLRKRLAEVRPYEAYDGDGITVCSSPDGRFALVFSHGSEVTMMNYRYYITLFDGRGQILNLLKPAQAVKDLCAWSLASARFAVPIAHGQEAVFIYDVGRAAFSVLRVSGRQYVFGFKRNGTLRLEFDPTQLKAMNAHDKKSQCPVEKFRAPEPCVIDVGTLALHPEAKLRKLEAIVNAAPEVKMDAEEDGYFPFKGPYPARTDVQINGRRMEVFQLMLFAGHGDRQSQRWLEEIRKKVAEEEVSPWDQVSKHLGRRVREKE